MKKFLPRMNLSTQTSPWDDPGAEEDLEDGSSRDEEEDAGGDGQDPEDSDEGEPDSAEGDGTGQDVGITRMVEATEDADTFGMDLLLLADLEHDETEPEEPEDEEPEEEDLTCFVATAAFRDHAHPDVAFLRQFRDEILTGSAPGRLFISAYWTVGPILAVPVRRSDVLAAISRRVIGIIVRALRRTI